ncbi:TorF family putative porin [Sphingomonas donggukensis]|uniref:TorF family putative porin n=1 Tax=Sphingomonas donggukensis TaxID=2949093 RepID=A0ABY4TZP3_9SPHN|nr:TorF family putative porin [Sphingomonas donggukensis]URW75793.1 TorF family putative porin [Sphingomonas donggukensis]
MMRFSTLGAAAILIAAATPAAAQDSDPATRLPDPATAPPPALTVTGSATLISDYRFRGLTQTDGKPAIQGTVNVNHSSGFYVGTFVSTIDGGPDGSTPALTGYGEAEVDLYGGFTKTLSNGVGIDVGLLYYLYPIDKTSGLNTDFFEPYAAVTYTIGPVATKLGAAYAWGGQDGLAGFDPRGGNDDNLYAYGEASVAIPTTPVTLKGHLGYSEGSLGGFNGTLDNNYLDWSVTAEAVGGPLKVGVSYVDTDISERRTAAFPKGYARSLGRGATVLAYVGFAF